MHRLYSNIACLGSVLFVFACGETNLDPVLESTGGFKKFGQPSEAEECEAEEQSTEIIAAGTTLSWDSALRCVDVADTGEYEFSVTVSNDFTSTQAVTIDTLVLSHTTPRPRFQAPEAAVDTISGLPATIAPGMSAEFSVRGEYTLVQTGEGRKANLHFRAKGLTLDSGEPFLLGINLFLRASGASE